MKLALKTIGIAIFSISMLVSFGLTSNQAFAGFSSCEDCRDILATCESLPPGTQQDDCFEELEECIEELECEDLNGGMAVGGELIGIDSTMVLAAGAQYTAAWMIPVIVSAIGIGIVIARKF